MTGKYTIYKNFTDPSAIESIALSTFGLGLDYPELETHRYSISVFLGFMIEKGGTDDIYVDISQQDYLFPWTAYNGMSGFEFSKLKLISMNLIDAHPTNSNLYRFDPTVTRDESSFSYDINDYSANHQDACVVASCCDNKFSKKMLSDYFYCQCEKDNTNSEFPYILPLELS